MASAAAAMEHGIKSILGKVDAMNVNFSKQLIDINMTLSELPQLREHVRSTNTKLIELHNRLEVLESKQVGAVLDAQVAAEFAKLEAKINSSSLAGSSAGSTASFPSAKKRHIDTGIPAGPGRHDDPLQAEHRDKLKVWITGFVSPMLGATLEQHGRMLLGLIPSQHSAGTTIRGYNLNQSYSIRFSSEAGAKHFVEQFKNAAPQSQDTATNTTITLRVRYGAPMSIRAKNKYLGRLWQAVMLALKSDGTWHDKFTMGSNGFKGVLYIETDNGIFVLFTLVAKDRDQFECDPNSANLTKFGLDSDAVAEM
ncbi:unnamed protein product, partial [Prorocentrum cordatum]